ncbi:MAG: nuclear transport factor 2 family protein [Pseudomonadales bacterium]|jgi:ketosteroid isomerase-like protein|nr:nuclear transport factor 2 family protein [Pseudomonadales bacterium]
MTNAELAERLFAGLAAGDAAAVGELCADDFRGHQNAGPAMDLATLMNFTRAVLGVVDDFRYEEAVRSTTETGFVEEHRVRGTLPDGSALDLAACVVGEVRDGRVVELREYLDSRAARTLLAALA